MSCMSSKNTTQPPDCTRRIIYKDKEIHFNEELGKKHFLVSSFLLGREKIHEAGKIANQLDELMHFWCKGIEQLSGEEKRLDTISFKVDWGNSQTLFKKLGETINQFEKEPEKYRKKLDGSIEN